MPNESNAVAAGAMVSRGILSVDRATIYGGQVVRICPLAVIFFPLDAGDHAWKIHHAGYGNKSAGKP